MHAICFILLTAVASRNSWLLSPRCSFDSLTLLAVNEHRCLLAVNYHRARFGFTFPIKSTSALSSPAFKPSRRMKGHRCSILVLMLVLVATGLVPLSALQTLWTPPRLQPTPLCLYISIHKRADHIQGGRCQWVSQAVMWSVIHIKTRAFLSFQIGPICLFSSSSALNTRAAGPTRHVHQG